MTSLAAPHPGGDLGAYPLINNGVLDNLDKIVIYPIKIDSEESLAKDARIANLSMNLGYKLEDEKRVLTKDEAYQQISHSASMFKAILK